MKSILLKSMIAFVIIIGMGSITNAQNNEIRTNGNAYFYQSQKYKIQDLGPLLYDDIESSLLYEQGKRKFKSAKTLGIVGITTIGLGLITRSYIEEPDNLLEVVILSEPNSFAKATSTLLIGVGVASGIIAFTKYLGGTRTMDKAVRIFNSKNNPMGYKSTLHMGLTGNGMGLVLGF